MGFNADLMIGATARRPICAEIKYDIVFVGNTALMRGGRAIVRDLGETKYNFKVWGRGWEGILPEKNRAGSYIDNWSLGNLYASSLIALSDHRENMRREGFVTLRVFDILASGGFCISDRNRGLDEIFGDAVPQYDSPGQLRELIDFYVEHPEERARLMKKGREIALGHTWQKRAEQFLSGLEMFNVKRINRAGRENQ
jgi:spore maturation protein CgeB